LTLRGELEDEPIRFCTIMPGAVATISAATTPPEFVNRLRSPSDTVRVETEIYSPDEMLETLNARASSIFASPDDIARACSKAVTQPHDLSVSEIPRWFPAIFPSHA